MKKLIIFILMSLLCCHSAYASGVYGPELLLENGCEGLSTGMRLNGNMTWRPYYNSDVAYAEVISAADYPEYVRSGDRAIRFCNAGNGGGRGVYYHSDIASNIQPGEVYEVTGYFKTDNPNGATLYVTNGNTYYEGGQDIPINGEWQKITARYVCTESDTAVGLRLSTNLKVATKESDFTGSTGDERYLQWRESLNNDSSAYFVYADDISLRKVISDDSAVRVIRSLNGTAAVIDENNNLYMWGSNENHLISPNDKDNIGTPMYIAGDVSDVALGREHMFILKTDGSVYGRGKNDFGQVGTGTTRNTDEFEFIMDGVKQISAGDEFSVAVTTDNKLYGWGRSKFNAYGTSTDCWSPTKMLDYVTYVSAAGAQTLVIRGGAALWACGYNGEGQLGLGTYLSPYRFTKVLDNVISVSAASEYTLAVTRDNSLYGFGWNRNGALGERIENSNVPFKIADGVISATAGENASLYVDNSYQLIKLGGENKGAFGDGEYGIDIIESGVCLSMGDEPIVLVKNGRLHGYNNGSYEIHLTNEENMIVLQNAGVSEDGFDVTLNGVNSPENVLLIKSYYKDNALVKCEPEETVLESNMTLHITPPQDSDNCRIMVWSGYANMKPLTDALEVEN